MKVDTFSKLSDICWDLWFIVGAIETKLKDQEITKKDSSLGCLFNYQENLDQIQSEITNLQISNNS